MVSVCNQPAERPKEKWIDLVKKSFKGEECEFGWGNKKGI